MSCVHLVLWSCDALQYSLHIGVSADDVLNLLRERVLEGERARSHPDPLARFRAEPKHHR